MSVAELEDLLGKKDEIKETEILMRSPKWIYYLSKARRLEVVTGGVGVTFAAIIEGEKVDLVWK